MYAALHKHKIQFVHVTPSVGQIATHLAKQYSAAEKQIFQLVNQADNQAKYLQ